LRFLEAVADRLLARDELSDPEMVTAIAHVMARIGPRAA
jgi:hypothetical protein